MKLIAMLILISILSLFALLILSEYLIEKRNYNNGICPRCGKKLMKAKVHNGYNERCYMCPNLDYTAWVYFKRIDKDQ